MKATVILQILLAAAICTSGLRAAEPGPVGTAFTYQGKLTDAGSPGDGEYDLMVSLFDVPIGGSPLTEPLHFANVAVAHGLFTLTLDFGPSFAGRNRWLEIAIRPGADDPYQTIEPRQLITPAPYAIHALGPRYTGKAPVTVDNATYTVGLNPATRTGDLLTWDGNNWVALPPAQQHFTADNMQPWLSVNFIIALQGIYPSRDSFDPFVGEIMMVGFNFAPRGWTYCNGQLMSISQNTALFSLLGTTYGGNGVTTFALPDLQGRVPVHHGQGPGLTGRWLGDKGGTETISK